jgi:hypothetical protein
MYVGIRDAVLDKRASLAEMVWRGNTAAGWLGWDSVVAMATAPPSPRSLTPCPASPCPGWLGYPRHGRGWVQQDPAGKHPPPRTAPLWLSLGPGCQPRLGRRQLTGD